ncbi:MAG: hypothetical protein QM648_10745 [Solirubrobacterales bacterium]
MAGRELEKQIDKALADFERWLGRQPGWKHGNLRARSGRTVSSRGPAVLSQADCALQFARFLNKHGVAWKDIHVQVSPSQWLVEKSVAGNSPRKIDLAIVDRDRLAKRRAPLRRHKSEEFLFDAVFEFTLVGNTRKRPPKAAIERSAKRVRRYLDDLWSRRGYVVVVEEASWSGIARRQARRRTQHPLLSAHYAAF